MPWKRDRNQKSLAFLSLDLDNWSTLPVIPSIGTAHWIVNSLMRAAKQTFAEYVGKRDRQGKTALDYAVQSNNKMYMDLLKNGVKDFK